MESDINALTHKILTLSIQKPEYLINSDGATAVVIRNWLSSDYAQTLHDRLVKEIPWIHGQMNFFGKTIDIPRELFFLGDANVKTYTYSRTTFPVQDWYQTINPVFSDIESIRARIQTDETLKQILNISLPFNTCLLNRYRDGNDKIDFHSDREALGPINAVVTISLGASRTFIFKNKVKGSNGFYPRITTVLNNGDLVLMAGKCQELWTHGIPRDDSTESRISLTYRLIN